MNEHSTLIDAVAKPAASMATENGAISISCYEGEVPPFVDAEMRRLYGNIHSTLAHLRIYGGLDDVRHTYVARRHGVAIAIFLFERRGNAVRIINEGMTIDDGEFERFAGYVFAAWREVATISFHAIQADIRKLAFPYQQYTCTANIVLPLPATVEEYVAGLGKNMRRNLRRYMDKLKRDFPGFRYDVYEKDEVDESHVRDVIDLNRQRIAGKNMRYGMGDEVEKVIALVKECGMVGVMTIDGKVVAGAVGYLAGDNYFFKVIAHDPKYNDYSAGILCTFLAINACIERGCGEYNFMWNEYEYKFALGAHSRSLHHVVLYRSRLQLVLHARTALGNAATGWRYRLSSLLDKAPNTETMTPGERFAMRILNGMRNAKRRLLRR
ncbi:GNAT family N-acetyltransferase [Herbaspirillum sp. HC18]|nr:GNAT family N-acetyltransferase [Herbaspirillum sp. HC18]